MTTRVSDDVLKIEEQVEAAKLANLSNAFIKLFERGTLSVELFAPRSRDTQTPHERDEIYIVTRGSGLFRRGQEGVEFKSGDFLFVSAGVDHRFERFSLDFWTWAIFFGPR